MAKLTLVIGNKNYSSWSLRPWLAMKQFGLDFDEVRIALYTPESTEKIQQYSPSGKVPVLIVSESHDTLTVWETLAICEYLAEQFPTLQWWPEDQTARAIARSVSAANAFRLSKSAPEYADELPCETSWYGSKQARLN